MASGSQSKPPPPQEDKLGGASRRATTPEKRNSRAALDSAAVHNSASKRQAKRQSKAGIVGLIGTRVAAATEHALDGPNKTLMRGQQPVWDVCATTTSA